MTCPHCNSGACVIEKDLHDPYNDAIHCIACGYLKYLIIGKEIRNNYYAKVTRATCASLGCTNKIPSGAKRYCGRKCSDKHASEYMETARNRRNSGWLKT